jgi:CcmD family protein
MDSRNFTFMFYGFAAAWLILIVYAVFLGLRHRKLKDELERVRRMVEDHVEKASGKKS